MGLEIHIHMVRTETESVRTDSESAAETPPTAGSDALVSPAMDFVLLFLATAVAALSVVVLF